MKECPICHRCFPDQINHCPTDGDILKFTIVGDPLLDGRYQLESRLAQGGMGAVFKARHIFLKTLHAIKVILPDLVGNDPSLVTRFRQEAMAAAAIRHPNIVAVTDFGVVQGTTPFLVMEFIQGKSLSDVLQEEGRLAPLRALEVMSGVCAGLGAAHRQGIVHRDLKPLNIMLRDDAGTTSESIKLLDFGLAKIKSGELLGSFVAAQTTGLMGSPFYMAPEQWGEEEPDRRADIYSLGVILYQMLAGEVPYKGSSIPSIMRKHLSGEPPRFVERGVDVPPQVEAVVQRALEKEPDQRPQTVEEFVAELREAVGLDPATTGGFSYGSRTNAETVTNIPRGDTLHPPQRQATGENLGGTHAGGAAGSGGASTAYAQQQTEALLNPSDAQQRDRHATIAEQTPRGGNNARGAETGRQLADRTAFYPSDADANRTSADVDARGGAGTPMSEEDLRLSAVRRRAEGEILALAEQARRKQEQERQQQHGGVSKETQALDAGTAQRWQEEEERRRREAGGQERGATSGANAGGQQTGAYTDFSAQQQQSGNMTSPQFTAQNTVGAEAFAAQGGGQPEQRLVGQHSAPSIAVASPPKSRAALMAVVGVVAALVLLSVAGGAFFVLKDRGVADPQPSPTSENRPTPAPSIAATKPDMVELPGGKFIVGRSDLPPSPSTLLSQGRTQEELAWIYTQWPAQNVEIPPFAIDRTEVTNAEYAEFVNATGYPPPPGIWDGNTPKPGQELWPVRNVTLEDAQRFAIWRSKRDNVQYRLPTEQEWEYAARGGDASQLYPWGREWRAGRANLDTDSLKPVGTSQEGASTQGVVDMIGNVWEWTSSEASMYKGNNLLKLRNEDEGKMVVRGGSYQSKPNGDKAITALARTWEPKDKRDPVIGFRLVRPAS